jgi:hypothetical protein
MEPLTDQEGTPVSIQEYVNQLEMQLLNMNRQLTLQGIHIQKLEAELARRNSNGQANGQEKELTKDKLVRNTKPAEVSHS